MSDYEIRQALKAGIVAIIFGMLIIVFLVIFSIFRDKHTFKGHEQRNRIVQKLPTA